MIDSQPVPPGKAIPACWKFSRRPGDCGLIPRACKSLCIFNTSARYFRQIAGCCMRQAQCNSSRPANALSCHLHGFRSKRRAQRSKRRFTSSSFLPRAGPAHVAAPAASNNKKKLIYANTNEIKRCQPSVAASPPSSICTRQWQPRGQLRRARQQLNTRLHAWKIE